MMEGQRRGVGERARAAAAKWDRAKWDRESCTVDAGLLKVNGVTRGINYGSDKVRFTSMVRVGKRVRLRQKLLAAEARAGGLQLKNECTIEIEGEDRPACVAETISVIYGA